MRHFSKPHYHQTVLDSVPSLRQRRLWLPRLKKYAGSVGSEYHRREHGGPAAVPSEANCTYGDWSAWSICTGTCGGSHWTAFPHPCANLRASRNPPVPPHRGNPGGDTPCEPHAPHGYASTCPSWSAAAHNTVWEVAITTSCTNLCRTYDPQQCSDRTDGVARSLWGPPGGR